jgi:cell wall assembly regulator SMI1
LLYDTDPASKGKFGQIIELQNESWDRNIVADSLEELIQNEIHNLKSGKIEHFDFIVGKES